MKIKLINKNTNQQFDCEEIEINGFKYYIIDTAVGCKYGISKLNEIVEVKMGYDATLYKGVICSNNPNIDIPKVVDEMADGKEIKELAKVSFYEETQIEDFNNLKGKLHFLGFAKGYNKSQETHPFSEKNMVEFAEWLDNNMQQREYYPMSSMNYKELLQLWKEQRPKIVYYVPS